MFTGPRSGIASPLAACDILSSTFTAQRMAQILRLMRARWSEAICFGILIVLCLPPTEELSARTSNPFPARAAMQKHARAACR
jgi:hypothetical protein